MLFREVGWRLGLSTVTQHCQGSLRDFQLRVQQVGHGGGLNLFSTVHRGLTHIRTFHKIFVRYVYIYMYVYLFISIYKRTIYRQVKILKSHHLTQLQLICHSRQNPLFSPAQPISFRWFLELVRFYLPNFGGSKSECRRVVVKFYRFWKKVVRVCPGEASW